MDGLIKVDNKSELRLLFFGDVVGRPGRTALLKRLPEIRNFFNPDAVIVNVENMAHGKGVTQKTLEELSGLNISAYTSGEHIYDKGNEDTSREICAAFPNLLKPANFAPEKPGRGDIVVSTPKGNVLVVSMIGQVFFPYDNLSPWTMLPEILERNQKDNPVAVVVDLHAEATSEKVAFARHFDGQVTAVFGTHTHIPTADATILPKGTAYVTDVGMNGPADSVLGMKSEISIERFLTGKRVPYDIAESSKVSLNYIELVVDLQTKKSVSIEHKHEIIDV